MRCTTAEIPFTSFTETLDHFRFVHNYTIEKCVAQYGIKEYSLFSSHDNVFQLNWNIYKTFIYSGCPLPVEDAHNLLNLIKRNEPNQNEQAFGLKPLEKNPCYYRIIVDISLLNQHALKANGIRHKQQLQHVANCITMIYNPSQKNGWSIGSFQSNNFENYSGLVTYFTGQEGKDLQSIRSFSRTDAYHAFLKAQEKYALFIDTQFNVANLYFCTLPVSDVNKLCLLPKNSFFINQLIPIAQTFNSKQALSTVTRVFSSHIALSSFTYLPEELLGYISIFLDVCSVIKLASTCKLGISELNLVNTLFKKEPEQKKLKEKKERTVCKIL